MADIETQPAGCLLVDIATMAALPVDDVTGIPSIVVDCKFSEYGIEADIKYNAIKSMVMIIRSKYNKDSVFPDLILTGAPLSISTEVKYLGHFMTDDFRDDRDINRQCRKLYAQRNMLIRKFHMCAADVKNPSPAVSVASKMDEENSDSEPAAPRQNMVSNAVRFLQNPKVKESSLTQRKAFLAKKGLTSHEIELAVQQSGTAGDVPVAPPPGNAVNHSVVPVHAVHPVVSPWARWRDRTATMIIIGGVSYSVYQLLQKYVLPLWLGPSEEQRRSQALLSSIAELELSLRTVVSSLGDLQKDLQEQMKQVALKTSAERGPMAYDRLQQQQGVSEIKTEIQSLKGLLLNRKQFPPTPKTTPVIPAWQLQNTSSTTSLSTSSTSLAPSDSDLVVGDKGPEQVSAALPTTKVAPPIPSTGPTAATHWSPATKRQQAEPGVAKQQAEPGVAKQQAEPGVAKQQAEPEVAKQQAEPEVPTEILEEEDSLRVVAKPTMAVLSNGVNQDGAYNASGDDETMETSFAEDAGDNDSARGEAVQIRS